MSFSPLLTASLPVILHAFAALFLCGLTLVLFTFKRGARAHRVLGWIWVCLMGFVALTSFWISDLRHFGPFSVIHALSLWTLISLVLNVRAARRHDVTSHLAGMKSLVFGALIVAGLFTLLPGRIMFDVVLGV
jgi:uncharacterized membrane protein